LLTGHGVPAVEPGVARALSVVAIGTQSDIDIVGYIFLGLGYLVFNWLWFRSGYVPKWLSIWGIAASAICVMSSFTFIVFPNLANLVCHLPIGTFELVMGFWLVVRGLRPVMFPVA
jgi:hypothetical protein